MVFTHALLSLSTHIRIYFYLANPPIMMFVGWGLRARNYFIHFLFFVQCLHVSKLYLGDPPVEFNGRKNSLDVGLAGSEGNSIFLSVERTGVSLVV